MREWGRGRRWRYFEFEIWDLGFGIETLIRSSGAAVGTRYSVLSTFLGSRQSPLSRLLSFAARLVNPELRPPCAGRARSHLGESCSHRAPPAPAVPAPQPWRRC